MKVGIIGSGGREHAICHSLKKSKKIREIYCFPGNAGTSKIAKNIVKARAEKKITKTNELVKIIEQSNLKFKDENENLKSQINDLNNKIVDYQSEISNQKQIINQFNIDTKELDYLTLNLEFSHKCLKSFFNNKGFVVGTPEYKKCVLNKGRIND